MLRRLLHALLAVAVLGAPAIGLAQQAGGLPANVLRASGFLATTHCVDVSSATIPLFVTDAGGPCGILSLPQTWSALQTFGTDISVGGVQPTGATGTGNLVFSVAPVLTLANATGLPLSTGVTGLLPVANGGTGTGTPGLVAGTNVTISGVWPDQTIASTGGSQVYPAAGIPNSTGTAWGTSYAVSGTGSVALTTSPVFTTPNLGTPSALTLTNATGLPIAGLTGLGTGMSSFLALAWPALVSTDCLTNNGTALAWGSCGTGTGITLQTNGVNNTTQTALNLQSSAATGGLALTLTNTGTSNVQLGLTGWPTLVASDCLTNNGTALSWGSCGTGSAITLQTNGTNNLSQTALNIESGTGITVTNPSAGNVQITATASAPTFDLIGTGTNLTATMTCATGCAITTSGTGTNSATAINGVAVPANADILSTDVSATPFATTPTGCITWSNRQLYNTAPVNVQSAAASYTLATTDQCALIEADYTSAFTLNLPPAGGSFPANFKTTVQEYSAFGVTITPMQIGLPTVGVPTTAQTGGSLPASTTYYVTVSAVDAAGQTTVQAVQSIATGAGTATNTVVVPITAGTNGTYATSYDVWYATATFAGGSTAIGYCTVAATASTFTIQSTTASPCNNSGTVPSANGTASTINGLTTLAIGTQYQYATLWSDGTNWRATGTAVGAAGGSGGSLASFASSSQAQAATTFYPGPAAAQAGVAGGLAATALTLKGLTYTTVNTPAAGQTFTVTVLVGPVGSETATLITCQISSPATSCSDLTDTAPIAAGQRWVIRVVTSATSGPTGFEYFGLAHE